MLDARAKAVRRSVIVAAVATLLAVPTGTGAGAAPRQEEPPASGDDAADQPLVDIDEQAAASPQEVAGTLSALAANVKAQLDQLDLARAAVALAESALADAESVVNNTELRIEELDILSDAVVVEAFVNPPIQDGVEVFSADSMGEATIKRAILDVHAADSANALTEFEEQQTALEVQKTAQEAALADADEARAEAGASLADLESAVSAQTQFILEVQRRLESDRVEAETNPELAAQILVRSAEMQEAIDAAEAAAQYAAALERLAEEQRRREALGVWECPVRGNVDFTDTWGAARSSGRTHQGTDMMAASGTPTVAPVSGNVEHRSNTLGGLTWYVYGDDGNMYYGAHLSAYENVGAGHVERGTVIGYVGQTGNAAATAPHLHFEYHPGGGSAVNPYSRLLQAC